LIFIGICVVGMFYGVTRIAAGRIANRPLEDWVRSQPVTYATRAKVRIRAPLGGWVDYKNGLGGVEFVVRTRGIEVSLVGGVARVHGSLGVERFLFAPESTMWLDSIGLYGTPVFRRKCIRLSGHDRNGRVELAISPIGDIDEAWQALLEAGVQADSGHDHRATLS
jgi:hypothetical protein